MPAHTGSWHPIIIDNRCQPAWRRGGASDTTNVATTKFTATAFDHSQATAGTAVEIHDSSYTTAVSDSLRASGIVTFHSSQSFSIVPETANGGTFESSAVASTLNKISAIVPGIAS